MNTKTANKSLWIAAQGNDMRGDDALAPKLVERLQLLPTAPNIDFHWDFQFCPEHALSFTYYDCVLLVDASTNIEKPFCLSEVSPDHEDTSTSHFLSPSALYKVFMTHVFEKDKPSPLVFQLEIKAYQFNLGSGISSQAQENLEKAYNHLQSTLLQHRCFMAFYAHIRNP